MLLQFLKILLQQEYPRLDSQLSANTTHPRTERDYYLAAIFHLEVKKTNKQNKTNKKKPSKQKNIQIKQMLVQITTFSNISKNLHSFIHYKTWELPNEAGAFKPDSSGRIHLQHSRPDSMFLKLCNVKNKRGLTSLFRKKS